jgi:hypothetical protein
VNIQLAGCKLGPPLLEGAAAALGSGVPKGCNSFQCAPLATSAGNQCLNYYNKYKGIKKSSQQQVNSQLAGCNLGPPLLEGAAAALGSGVPKGCNSFQCAPLVTSGGNQGLHQQGLYISVPQAVQNDTSKQLTCPTLQFCSPCAFTVLLLPAHAPGVPQCPAALSGDISHHLQHG